MKALRTIITALGSTLILSTAVYADRGHDHGNDRWGNYNGPRHVKMAYPRHKHNNNWVVPLVVGGVLGYALSEPRRESVTYTTSVYSPQSVAPVVYTPQPVYQEQWMYFSDCDCQRKVLVQVR